MGAREAMCFNKPFRWYWCIPKFENHCARIIFWYDEDHIQVTPLMHYSNPLRNTPEKNSTYSLITKLSFTIILFSRSFNPICKINFHNELLFFFFKISALTLYYLVVMWEREKGRFSWQMALPPLHQMNCLWLGQSPLLSYFYLRTGDEKPLGALMWSSSILCGNDGNTRQKRPVTSLLFSAYGLDYQL